MAWSKERAARHEAAYPAAEKRERGRLAQARYRERHARRLAAARQVGSILLRTADHHDDAERLADALRVLLRPSGIEALVRELSQKPRRRALRSGPRP
jgi:hypothetical protein